MGLRSLSVVAVGVDGLVIRIDKIAAGGGNPVVCITSDIAVGVVVVGC